MFNLRNLHDVYCAEGQTRKARDDSNSLFIPFQIWRVNLDSFSLVTLPDIKYFCCDTLVCNKNTFISSKHHSQRNEHTFLRVQSAIATHQFLLYNILYKSFISYACWIILYYLLCIYIIITYISWILGISTFISICIP